MTESLPASAVPRLAPALPATLRDREGRPLVLRRVVPEDREALRRFYERFEPKRAAQGLPPLPGAPLNRWLSEVLGGGAHLVVEMDDELVGHAMLMPTAREGVHEYAIFIDERVRGKGVGTQVNRYAVELARALGLRRLWLSVEPLNRAAVRSYQKAGFQFISATMYSPELEMELDLAQPYPG